MGFLGSLFNKYISTMPGSGRQCLLLELARMQICQKSAVNIHVLSRQSSTTKVNNAWRSVFMPGHMLNTK